MPNTIFQVLHAHCMRTEGMPPGEGHACEAQPSEDLNLATGDIP
jgi:hypothetical protein